MKADTNAHPFAEQSGAAERTLPKVTVVTVTYNAAETLQVAIDSVVAQHYPHIEYIVIDGGSVDGTVEIIRRNATTHIAYWTSEPDGGIYEAMNKGVQNATGDWILFLNADDAFYSNGAISSVFTGSGDTWMGKKVVYGHSVLQMERGRSRLRRRKSLRTIHFKMPFIHQGVFVPTELLRQRPFDIRYRLAAD